MVYIFIKLHENISKGFRVTKHTLCLISKLSKENNSVNYIGAVMVLVLGTMFHQNISKCFSVIART